MDTRPPHNIRPMEELDEELKSYSVPLTPKEEELLRDKSPAERGQWLRDNVPTRERLARHLKAEGVPSFLVEAAELGSFDDHGEEGKGSPRSPTLQRAEEGQPLRHCEAGPRGRVPLHAGRVRGARRGAGARAPGVRAMRYFVDIDGTLTDDPESPHGNPIRERVEKVRELCQKHEVVLWSARGEEYATVFANRNKIQPCRTIGKPDVIFDDCPTVRPTLEVRKPEELLEA